MLLTFADHEALVNSLNALITHEIEFHVAIPRYELHASLHIKQSLITNIAGNGIYTLISNRRVTIRSITNAIQNLTLIDSPILILSQNAKQALDDYKAVLTKISQTLIIQQRTTETTKPPKPKERSTFLRYLEGKYWKMYERKDKGIVSKVIYFEELDRYNNLNTTIFPHEKKFSELFGVTKLDGSGSFLIIQAANKDNNSSYTHIMLKIDTSSKPELLLGHMTFHHRNGNHVVSKTIMLADPSTTFIEPQEQIEPKSLPQAVLTYFRSKHQNRLSSPHEMVITNLSLLEEWHNTNATSKLSRLKKYSVEGEYIIFYNIFLPNDRTLCRDSMVISLDMHKNISVYYQHNFQSDAVNKTENQNWKGLGYINNATQTLTILLHGPYQEIEDEDVDEIDDRQMFILLNLPSIVTKATNTFTGIISGVRDEAYGGVARLFVAIRKETFVNEKYIEERVQEFLRLYTMRSRVRPPKMRISVFEDLKKTDLKKDALLEINQYLEMPDFKDLLNKSKIKNNIL